MRLNEAAADEVEGKLRGPFANTNAIAAEGAVDRVGALSIGDSDVDEADGFGFRCAGGAGYACDAEADGCAGARADAFSESFGDFSRNGAVLCDEIGGDTGKVGLELVRLDDNSAET